MVNDTARLDRTFGALADPTRRAIVARLSKGEATVGELARPFAVSLPAISRHLRVLEDAGLINRRREGRVHHCRLAPERMASAADWIVRRRAAWDARLGRLERHLKEGER